MRSIYYRCKPIANCTLPPWCGSWEAGNQPLSWWPPQRYLLVTATVVWEPREGGGEPPFSDDDAERTRNETAHQHGARKLHAHQTQHKSVETGLTRLQGGAPSPYRRSLRRLVDVKLHQTTTCNLYFVEK